MTFEQAYWRVAMAGRELGSGSHVAALAIDPNYEKHVEMMTSYGVPQLNAECIALGAVIGRVMLEEPTVMATLTHIATQRYGAGGI